MRGLQERVAGTGVVQDLLNHCSFSHCGPATSSHKTPRDSQAVSFLIHPAPPPKSDSQSKTK